MILDALLTFDPAGTPITAGGPSTNVLDLLNPRDMGIGTEPALMLLVLGNAAFAAAGAATLNIQLQGSADNVTWTTYSESSPLTLAQLTSMSQKLWTGALPHRAPAAPLPRYYRLNYVVASGPFTAGALQAYLTTNVDAAPAYPSGFNPAN